MKGGPVIAWLNDMEKIFEVLLVGVQVIETISKILGIHFVLWFMNSEGDSLNTLKIE